MIIRKPRRFIIFSRPYKTPKKKKDRWTWRNDALGLKKEIDYVLVRSLEGVTDVGVLTSVNVGSDHRVLRCKLRLDRITRPARRFRGFPITDKDLLSSTAQRLLNENVLTVDTIKDYDTLAHIITNATELSTRYEQLPPRLSDRTRNLLQRRRELRHGETGRNTAETIEYAEICKLARRSIQEDLRQRHIQILSHAIHTGRLRFGRMQLLHSKRQLTILKEATTALSRNSFDSNHETLAHGNPTSDSTDPDPRPNPPNSMSPPSATNEPDPESQTVRIVKNFYSNLYRSSSGPPTAPSEEIHLQVQTNEVHAALMTCKPRSAPGSDRITSPSLRILSEILASPIAWFFNDIIRTKAVPPGFAFANTILLYKNGNPTDVTNYRPISLLSTLYKVLMKILTRRLRNTIDKGSILPPEQAGFRRNFSSVDHIHALNVIAEKCYEFNIQLCAGFVDFKKAFDSVELPMLWQALESFGVDTNMIKAVQLLYANSSAAIKIGNQLVNFELQRGVRQGDSMSPILFTIVLQ
ncbi:hypothetical protein Y032_0002g955 [Ancylostoma ceylanicum]|uniref:Reverse transcriptase domain-containing protein n=1 Tax=Ancylostoma ceylanicum TaxID=53326 RepID=A0A016W1K4_9BILA|nr:hypothetical protein Y032_0002g955 [Ancylostoma ceylanicum]